MIRTEVITSPVIEISLLLQKIVYVDDGAKLSVTKPAKAQKGVPPPYGMAQVRSVKTNISSGGTVVVVTIHAGYLLPSPVQKMIFLCFARWNVLYTRTAQVFKHRGYSKKMNL